MVSARDFASDFGISFDSGQNRLIEISALEGTGVDLLEETIRNLFLIGEISFHDEIYLTNARQKAAMEQAYQSILHVRSSIAAGMPLGMLSVKNNLYLDFIRRRDLLIGKAEGSDGFLTAFLPENRKSSELFSNSKTNSLLCRLLSSLLT